MNQDNFDLDAELSRKWIMGFADGVGCTLFFGVTIYIVIGCFK